MHLLLLLLALTSPGLAGDTARVEIDFSDLEPEPPLLRPYAMSPQPEPTGRLARAWRHHQIRALKRHAAPTDAGARARLAGLTLAEARDPALPEAERAIWLAEAITQYEALLKGPPSEQLADWTYALATARWAAGDRERAQQDFVRLVKTAPDSAHVPDASLWIGEHHFEQNVPYKALIAYQRALSHPDPGLAAYARYKLGWCYELLGAQRQAIEQMRAVIARPVETGGDEDARLRDAAIEALARLLAEAGELDAAFDELRSLGRGDAMVSALMAVAEVRFAEGAYEQSVLIWRRLIAEDPLSPAAPRHQLRIAAALRQMSRSEQALEEIEACLRACAPGSPWRLANAARPEAVASARAQIERDLFELATSLHREALKLGMRNTQNRQPALATRAYSLWLASFAGSPQEAELRWAFGELLWKMRRYDEAYAEYMAVVALDANGPHARFCAEAAIHAAEEVRRIEPRPDTPRVDPRPLSTWETKAQQANEQYAALYPDDPKTTRFLYDLGVLLYDANRFDEAEARFRAVIARAPGDHRAEMAALLIVDGRTKRQDWPGLVEVTRAMMATPGLGSEDLHEELQRILDQATQDAQQSPPP